MLIYRFEMPSTSPEARNHTAMCACVCARGRDRALNTSFNQSPAAWIPHVPLVWAAVKDFNLSYRNMERQFVFGIFLAWYSLTAIHLLRLARLSLHVV